MISGWTDEVMVDVGLMDYSRMEKWMVPGCFMGGSLVVLWVLDRCMDGC